MLRGHLVGLQPRVWVARDRPHAEKGPRRPCRRCRQSPSL